MESNSSSSQESTASTVPVIDAEGYTVCPDCDSCINCGTVRLANLEKRHRGKKVCKAAQEKRDKKARKKQNGDNGTILAFLKPKAARVSLMVDSRAPAHGTESRSQQSASLRVMISPTIPEDKAASSEVPDTGLIINNIIDILKDLVDNLPD